MKVALLAGGLGTRMREETEFKPKPMVEVGGKPVLWHIMKNFACHGYTDFVILAGYKAWDIKQYFHSYLLSNQDFTVSLGDPSSIRYHGKNNEADWTVTVVDTGLDTPTGGRLVKARRHLGDSTFICTYGDGLASVDVSKLVELHSQEATTATVTVTQPFSRFGVVETSGTAVLSFREKPQIESSVSIGYFVFEPEIFAYLAEDSVLENEPLDSLAQRGEVSAFRHSGFWQPLDTYREYQAFNKMWSSGNAPWKTWSDS